MTIPGIFAVLATLLLVIVAIVNHIRFNNSLNEVNEFSEKIKKMEDSDRETIINEIKKGGTSYSNWSLLIIAHKHQWSPKLISCLPSLYFSKKGTHRISYIWKEVFNQIPNSLELEKLATYCNGEIIKIKAAKNAELVVEAIAERFEKTRLQVPYNHTLSLNTALNQEVMSFEYEIKSKHAVLADAFRNKRKLNLHNNLQLALCHE